MGFIDRRLNGRNKNASNRERVIRRLKNQLEGAVKRMVADRSITDSAQKNEVKIPARDMREPNFSYGQGGDWERVYPGNKKFIKGDKIARPENGGGIVRGNQPGDGSGVDDFIFALSRDEFLKIFFDGLELPNMMRTAEAEASAQKFVRAGYVKEGTPSNLSVPRTVKTGLARRIALGAPIKTELDDLEATVEEEIAKEDPDQEKIGRIKAAIIELKQRKERIPFLSDTDVRYRHRVPVPRPISRAVMFCLMDVSASMDERKKDLAKRFYTLLYLFLTRKYERVELVFIRHTSEAQEVSEIAFFYDTQSGGTVVLSALELMYKICVERYPMSEWNTYVAQASDGDAFGSDPKNSARFLQDKILPISRYYAYIEVPDQGAKGESTIWSEYDDIAKASPANFAMQRVRAPSEVYPVFVKLFKKGRLVTA